MEKRGLIIIILLYCTFDLILVSAGSFIDKTALDFNNGSYINTFYNFSGFVQLNNSYLTGTYISRIFDAGSLSRANNLTLNINLPNLNLLFAVDNNADVWKSNNSGLNWSLIKDDYNNGEGNGARTGFFNNESLFVIYNQQIWVSSNFGINWTKVNDNYNGAEGQNAFASAVDKNNNFYIIEGDQDVWRSNNLGVNWTKIATNFNAGGGNVAGLIVNSSNVLIAVDVASDVYASYNSGLNWNLIRDDYNNGEGNGADALTIDNSDVLYILKDQAVWKSNNSGLNWTKASSDFDTADSHNGISMASDYDNKIYLIDGNEDLYKSDDFGVTWNKQVTNFNGGNGNSRVLVNNLLNSSLTLFFKNCSLSNCSDGNWQLADLNNINLTGRYFQYRVNFSREDILLIPKLYNISFDYRILNTAPSLIIASPQNGANYSYNKSISLNFSAIDIDINLDKCWYNLDNGLNISIVNCQNTSFDVSGNGNYELNVFVNDSLGLITNKNINFSVNVDAPTIILYTPINAYLNSNNITFSYVPSDIDLNSCELWGNFYGVFKSNHTDSSVRSGWINYFYLNLSDGNYLWNVRCNDSQGHSAFNGNKSFYVDTITPSLVINEPNGKKTSRTGISLIFNVSDNSLDKCWYNVYRGVNVEISNKTINCSILEIFNVTVDADFILNFYVNDSAGNQNFLSSSFSVDISSITSPSGGSGGGGGGSSSSSSVAKTEKLEISSIGNMIVHEGDKKTLSINAKNIGTKFLNNCKLSIIGEINSWFYSSQISGIAPGENKIFLFDLNVPEDVEEKDYLWDVEVNCDETTKSSSFTISIPRNSAEIEIKEIKQEKNNLKINYIINSDRETSVNIWIVDKDGKEIKRIKDNGKGERSIVIELENGLIGIYSIYFAPSSSLDNFVKQSLVLGKSSATGLAILDQPGNKLIGYVVFVLIICIAVFFIVRSKNEETHKTKHRVLFGKKEF